MHRLTRQVVVSSVANVRIAGRSELVPCPAASNRQQFFQRRDIWGGIFLQLPGALIDILSVALPLFLLQITEGRCLQ